MSADLFSEGRLADEGDMEGLRWRSAAGPAVFAILAIALLIYDHLNRRVDELLFWLTLALIVAVSARMIETVRKQSGALHQHEQRSLSDPVTGLQNRRKLQADLKATLAEPSQGLVLVLLELDGLQAYGDRLGYAVSDELLRRSAHSLVEAVDPLGGGAYRVDAGRLAALVPRGRRRVGDVVRAATGSLREEEVDPAIGRSYGEVAIPDETADPEVAFQIAGRRLAAHRQRQQRSARRQAHAVLIAALTARRPELRDRLRVVTYQAISLARRLGVGNAEIDDIALAAELRDVGLLAAPESMPEKETPLDERETAMIQTHTVDGERIIGAAPGLASVAALVRSSSERFDGSGYPDGLASQAIPLGSRIVAVAAAFAAMTAQRPYYPAMSHHEALAELRRCAGVEFDPRVVEALAKDLEEEAAPAPAPTPVPA
jgi:two-component system cell cycle response regulator